MNCDPDPDCDFEKSLWLNCKKAHWASHLSHSVDTLVKATKCLINDNNVRKEIFNSFDNTFLGFGELGRVLGRVLGQQGQVRFRAILLVEIHRLSKKQ